MRRKSIRIILVFLTALVMSACTNKADNGDINESAAVSPTTKANENAVQEVQAEEETGGEQAQMQKIMLEVGGQSFQAELYDNETARAFRGMLPMTLNMDELHGNEKFYYLEKGLPTNAENVGSIQTGDLMLFGSDCLVLFFEDFSTSYSYTRIGFIEEAQTFANALAKGTVEVTIRAAE